LSKQSRKLKSDGAAQIAVLDTDTRKEKQTDVYVATFALLITLGFENIYIKAISTFVRYRSTWHEKRESGARDRVSDKFLFRKPR